VIERPHKKCRVTIHSARPGVVIGKKGADIDKLRKRCRDHRFRRRHQTSWKSAKPELDATLVAESIAQQLERRVAFRRAMKRAVQSAMRLGAEGIRIIARAVSRRRNRAHGVVREGRVPLHTLRADVDYGVATAFTTFAWASRSGSSRRDPRNDRWAGQKMNAVATHNRRRRAACAAARGLRGTTHARDFGAAETAEQLIRMPSAEPHRRLDARFMAAERNAALELLRDRFGDQGGVEFGLRISTMLMTTSESVISATRLRSLSMSAPFLPITTPGRAEWIVTRHFLCGRSITMRATAACLSSLCRISRILTSSCSSLPYSFLPANQRESQVRLMPRRSRSD